MHTHILTHMYMSNPNFFQDTDDTLTQVEVFLQMKNGELVFHFGIMLLNLDDYMDRSFCFQRFSLLSACEPSSVNNRVAAILERLLKSCDYHYKTRFHLALWALETLTLQVRFVAALEERERVGVFFLSLCIEPSFKSWHVFLHYVCYFRKHASI